MMNNKRQHLQDKFLADQEQLGSFASEWGIGQFVTSRRHQKWLIKHISQMFLIVILTRRPMSF